MPTAPSPAQSEASRANGVCSAGPATEAGKARAAMNAVRHGMCGRTLFLLADEDAAAFAEHEAEWLAAWQPRDVHEHEAALAAIRAMWREIRADRLDAQAMGDLFAAGRIADEAERATAQDRALKAVNTLLRYKARLDRELRQAREALAALRARRLAPPRPHAPAAPAAIAASAPRPDTGRQNEPEPARAPLAAVPAAPADARPSEPERPALNRHQRRALAALERRRAA
jgi:hypothetical protein